MIVTCVAVELVTYGGRSYLERCTFTSSKDRDRRYVVVEPAGIYKIGYRYSINIKLAPLVSVTSVVHGPAKIPHALVTES